jgi:Peptidase inhibitor I9
MSTILTHLMLLNRKVVLWSSVAVICFVLVIASASFALVRNNHAKSTDVAFLNRDRSTIDSVPIVPNQFVVIFHKEDKSTGGTLAARTIGHDMLTKYKSENRHDSGSRILYDYNYVVHGVAISDVSNQLIKYLQQHQAVKYVEEVCGIQMTYLP